jgi:hypothetical protein
MSAMVSRSLAAAFSCFVWARLCDDDEKLKIKQCVRNI